MHITFEATKYTQKGGVRIHNSFSPNPGVLVTDTSQLSASYGDMYSTGYLYCFGGVTTALLRPEVRLNQLLHVNPARFNSPTGTRWLQNLRHNFESGLKILSTGPQDPRQATFFFKEDEYYNPNGIGTKIMGQIYEQAKTFATHIHVLQFPRGDYKFNAYHRSQPNQLVFTADEPHITNMKNYYESTTL